MYDIHHMDNYHQLIQANDDIPFYLEFLKKPVYNIDGFIAAKYGGELLISFFKLDNEERKENIRDID